MAFQGVFTQKLVLAYVTFNWIWNNKNSGYNKAGLLMGDDVETGGNTGSDYWAACTTLVERKSKQAAIDDRPKLVSSPINNPA